MRWAVATRAGNGVPEDRADTQDPNGENVRDHQEEEEVEAEGEEEAVEEEGEEEEKDGKSY